MKMYTLAWLLLLLFLTEIVSADQIGDKSHITTTERLRLDLGMGTHHPTNKIQHG